jgi:c(7)-type cytochrome triheme protein
MDKRKMLRWAAVLLVAGVTGFSTAGDLKNLPADYVFTPGEGSPGPVTFSHATHVDADRPSCLTCHPSWFRILVKGETAGGERITHDRMEKQKQACGACHGGKAFGFEDCSNCHRM